MFRNLRIGAKLLVGFGVVMLLLAGGMGIYHYAIGKTTVGFEKLMREEVNLATHAATIKSSMLQCRRNEKDFLLRLDKKYVGRLEKKVEHIKSEAGRIIEISEQSGNRDAADIAGKIVADADAYLESFKSLVASWETRGLDHTSGLQGSFRNIVRGLGEDIMEHLQHALRPTWSGGHVSGASHHSYSPAGMFRSNTWYGAPSLLRVHRSLPCFSLHFRYCGSSLHHQIQDPPQAYRAGMNRIRG